MYITLRQIKANQPCERSWNMLQAMLSTSHFSGVTMDTKLPLRLGLTLWPQENIKSNVDDVLWCFNAVDTNIRERKLFVVWLAQQAKHLMTDVRSRDALEVAERFANGEASAKERAAAVEAANRAVDEIAGFAIAYNEGRAMSADDVARIVGGYENIRSAAPAARAARAALGYAPSGSTDKWWAFDTMDFVLRALSYEARRKAELERTADGTTGSLEAEATSCVRLSFYTLVAQRLDMLFDHTESGRRYEIKGLAPCN